MMERHPGMKKIRIFLIEDNRILRDGIEAIVNEQADLRIVGSSEGNQETLRQAKTLKPRVILVDLGLRDEDTLRLVKMLSKEVPDASLIGMGLIPSRQEIVEFLQAGAAGFILKDATIDEMLESIRAVAGGEKILPPVVTGSLFTHVVDEALRKGNGTLPNAVRMTTREREIIVLIAEGMSNKEIAMSLSLSTYTVKSHIHNILEKLALHSRLEIATHSYANDLP